mmetsp:Transcript_32730/g.66845  ORF Transcript_32730/g.66845 Transcript_32730/m.66845 type:complete len:351 (+) Transcript_32730:75-1127(+)|eukprot:CAMPEP_0171615322 /NCGR_PEP_ID=MMETSP0990-20121206/12828_1 /TAXON_ID=483369 /ORGANISM="non described non described, Strain CCMP2098" /LENGTH=350 /DNA_ID=CAMNT_0012179405 /DNA_START=68 /DNA_END=1120 /DNA_ORIENTATION=-
MARKMDSGHGSWGSYTESEEYRINETLRTGLPKEFVKQRPGAGGKKVDYLEGGAQLEIANHVFGALNWSSEVLSLDVDYCRQDRDKWCVGASALVRVKVKTGAFHEDVGYAVSKDSDQGAALERARKAAVTDGRKRALRCFGELLGNSLKHKDDNSRALNENFEAPLMNHSPVCGIGGHSAASSSALATPNQNGKHKGSASVAASAGKQFVPSASSTPLLQQQQKQPPPAVTAQGQKPQQMHAGSGGKPFKNTITEASPEGGHVSSFPVSSEMRQQDQQPARCQPTSGALNSGSPNEVDFEYTLPASVQPPANSSSEMGNESGISEADLMACFSQTAETFDPFGGKRQRL